MSRAPRRWTMEEDSTLLRETEGQAGQGNQKDWHQIAAAIPGRNNKDCRKRWYKINGETKKGLWEPEEDRQLLSGVQKYGCRWSLVSQEVETRNSDQCAKRWQHSLDPSLDHSEWTPEEDRRIRTAVDLYGRDWKKIEDAVFSGRSSSNIKNRYATLMRRRKPDPSVACSEHSSRVGVSEEMPHFDLAASVDWDELMATVSQGPQTSLPMPTTPEHHAPQDTGTVPGSMEFEGPPRDQQSNANFCPSFVQGGTLVPCNPSWSNTNLPWLPLSSAAENKSHAATSSSFCSASPPCEMVLQNHSTYSTPSLFTPQVPDQCPPDGWASAGGSALGSPIEQPRPRCETPKAMDSILQSCSRPTKTTLVLDDLDPATMASMMQVLRQSQTKTTITMNS